jgi:hypothetical protein
VPFVRNEIRFFMDARDYAEFERFLDALGASVRDSSIVHPHIGSVNLQLLKSGFDVEALMEGRLALATTGFGVDQSHRAEHLEAAERLYKKLQAYIKKSYSNDVVRWQNPDLPRSATNPGKIDKACWVGPGALKWWGASVNRTFRNVKGGSVEAYRGT